MWRSKAKAESNGAPCQIIMGYFLVGYSVGALSGSNVTEVLEVVSLSHVGDILQASDNLSRVINSYKKIIEGQVLNGEVDLPGMSVVEGEFWGSQLIQS